ncbi:hypothetical protein NYE33_00440 [Paenibacillus sp. FSL R10-2199]|uniref:hypothetical protein n=1 Tax=Paenibacillus sp. FSL R10-2199 TaxID=2975348 RepID=UPI0030FAC7EA
MSFFAARVIHDEKYKLLIPAFRLLGPNLIHDPVHTSALHTIDTPRGVIQKICGVAQVTIALGRLLDLGNILSSGTQNDAEGLMSFFYSCTRQNF